MVKKRNRITKTIVVNVGSGVVSKEDKDASPVLRCNGSSNNYFFSVADGWKHLVKVKSHDNWMFCHLNCNVCSPDGKYSILVGNDEFIHRYTTKQNLVSV
jgi:hypothetical protein